MPSLSLQWEHSSASWKASGAFPNASAHSRVTLCVERANTSHSESEFATQRHEVLEQLSPLVESQQGNWRLQFRESNGYYLVDLISSLSSKEFVLWCQNQLATAKYDYLIWHPSSKAPKLMVFDMDSTFIQIEVIDELAQKAGVGKEVAAVTEKAMRGELDFAQSLIHRVSCLKGLNEETIEHIAANLPLSIGAEDLVRRADCNGVYSAIVSGGFRPFVEKLKSFLPLLAVKANILGVENSRLTGKVEGDIVDAQAKAEFVIALCQQLNIKTEQVLAVGDGANDLKMMAQSGYSVAYQAKPAVAAAAKGRLNEMSLDVIAAIFDWR